MPLPQLSKMAGIVQVRLQRMHRVTNNTITTQKDHNHPRDQAAIEVEKIVIELKEPAKETIRPIPTLYHEKIQGISTMPNKEEVSC